MTPTEWMLVVAAGAWVVLVLALCVLVARAIRAVDEVITSVQTVTDEAVPILRGVNDTVSGVNVELARVDTIIAGVQSITATTDRLVGVVHTVVTNPVIKAAALSAGIRRAVGDFRARSAAAPPAGWRRRR